jgi:hypothetical protein
MKTHHSYAKNNYQSNPSLIELAILNQQSYPKDSRGEKMDTVRRLTLLLGFAQATLANQYEKKHSLSKKLFNQASATDLQNDDTKKIVHEMQLIQEEMNIQLAKVNRLTAELGEAESDLSKEF